MVFLWFSSGFPMVLLLLFHGAPEVSDGFLGFFYGLAMVFMSLSYGFAVFVLWFPRGFHGFPEVNFMVLPWISYGFLVVFLWFCFGFTMVILWFPYSFE